MSRLHLKLLHILIAGLFLANRAVLCGEEGFRVEGSASVWWIIHEAVENGLVQNGSLDPAVSSASGFNLREGRIAFAWKGLDGKLESLIKLRLEERTELLDAYVSYAFKSWFILSAGQMRIPSTREGMTSYSALDFVSKSTFAKHVSDYSLSRTPYISSVMSVKSYGRDTGISIKGKLKRISWMFMVSNGIGAGSYIGGREDEGFIYTNRFGDYYYGSRIEAVPSEWLTVGLHASRNTHRDVAISSRGPVLDFSRSVWTVDLLAVLPYTRRLYAFYGKGEMDDYSLSLSYLFEYEGWGLSLILPILCDKLEAGGRYDRFETKYKTGSIATVQDNITVGLKFRSDERLHLLLNYINKKTDSELPDLKDDILLIDIRFLFDSGI